MANSINTNVGAQVALQNLNQTSRELAVTQNRVNTGQKVSSAKDNACRCSTPPATRCSGPSP